MLIRSQNKKVLCDMTGSSLEILQTRGTEGEWSILCNGTYLAIYSSESKALKVLDQMQNYMIKNIYIMPQDSEVTVKEDKTLLIAEYYYDFQSKK